MSNTAILALGKNWELPVPPDPADIRLSIESEMTAEAAGILFVQGLGNLIIFSAGQTAGPNYPSESSKMRESMYRHFDESEVPLSKTVLQEASYTTETDLCYAKELLPELGIDEVVLLSIGYHVPRANRSARIRDVPVSAAYKSDYVLRRGSGDKHVYGKRVIQKSMEDRSLKPVLRTTASYGLEGLSWGLTVIDPRVQHIAKYATRKIRHQT